MEKCQGRQNKIPKEVLGLSLFHKKKTFKTPPLFCFHKEKWQPTFDLFSQTNPKKLFPFSFATLGKTLSSLFFLFKWLLFFSFLFPLANLFSHPKTNLFLLFLGGFYSQGRSLQGAASMVSKWGGCLGGCSCRKQGEEKGESDGQVG